MAPPTTIKYPHVTRQLCVMANNSRQKSSKTTVALRITKARGRRTVVFGQMQSKLRKWPSVYPAFAVELPGELIV